MKKNKCITKKKENEIMEKKDGIEEGVVLPAICKFFLLHGVTQSSA